MQGRPLVGVGVCRSGHQGDVGPHQPAVSPAFQAQAQPAPCRHSRILVGRRAGLPPRPEDRIDKGRCSGAGRCGAGGEGSPQGPLPPLRQWLIIPNRELPGSREEGQVEEKRAGQEGRKGERRKWREGREREEGEEGGR